MVTRLPSQPPPSSCRACPLLDCFRTEGGSLSSLHSCSAFPREVFGHLARLTCLPLFPGLGQLACFGTYPMPRVVCRTTTWTWAWLLQSHPMVRGLSCYLGGYRGPQERQQTSPNRKCRITRTMLHDPGQHAGDRRSCSFECFSIGGVDTILTAFGFLGVAGREASPRLLLVSAPLGTGVTLRPFPDVVIKNPIGNRERAVSVREGAIVVEVPPVGACVPLHLVRILCNLEGKDGAELSEHVVDGPGSVSLSSGGTPSPYPSSCVVEVKSYSAIGIAVTSWQTKA